MELVKINHKEYGIEKSRAEQIEKTFAPMSAMLQEFESKYNEIIAESKLGITPELSVKAKRVRLDIAKVRIETGKLKDKQKEYIKLEDKAIMGVHNILVWAVTEKEDNLKGIENHAEIMEQKRLKELQDSRVEELSPYVEDAHERQLSAMDDDVWSAYFATKKKEHEDRIAAEKQAEADRIAKEKAEEVERERIRKENEKLKAEAEKQRIQAEKEAAERAKEDAERQAKAEAERKAQEEKERKEREAHEAAIAKERAERQRIEKELQAKAEAERKAQAAAEAAKQAELNKGDADKVNDLIAELNALKTKYKFQSKKNQKMYSDVGLLIDKVTSFITK